MFDFMFGGKKKLELIRELVEQRMASLGFSQMEHRLHIKQMGNLQLMGQPEGTIVTIVETVIKLQAKGVLLNQVLGAIEDHRKRTGHDPDAFAHIQSLCRKSSEDAGAAVPLYTLYRVNLEHPGMMTEEQFESAFLQAVQTLSK